MTCILLPNDLSGPFICSRTVMKTLLYPCRLSLVALYFLLATIFMSSTQAQTYYALAGSALLSITVGGGGCSITVVALLPPAPGVADAIAICAGGDLYVSNNLGQVFFLDINTLQFTHVANTPGIVTALTCSGNGLLYAGTFDGQLITIDPSSGAVTVLGALPYPAVDLVFLNGNLYVSTAAGLVLADLSNPSASTLLFPTPTPMTGLSVGPECGTLLGSSQSGVVWEIDLQDESSTGLCNGPWALLDMTSADEFNQLQCQPLLDLDDDDSSGAPDFDFNAPELNCLTVGGLNIADEDVKVVPYANVATMTIVLTDALDGADEVLILNNPPPGISVSGTGTQAITLTNTLNASAADFEQALRSILYFNYANPFTPGLRKVQVSFVNILAQQSNEATAYISVVELPDVAVDLGPDLKICAGESATLDAGSSGDQYLWNTGATTQTITVTNPGEYSVSVSAAGHCPSSDKIFVQVLPIRVINLDGPASICAGETTTLTITSNYTQLLNVLLHGSDGSQQALTVMGFKAVQVMPVATITYSLEVPNPPETICLQFNNSDVTIVVHPKDTTYTSVFICAGDSIFLAGAWQRDSGVFFTHLTNVLGCDSTIITALAVIPPVVVTMTATTCDPQQAGVTTIVLPAQSGCDSIIITTTELLPSDTVAVTDFSCNPADTGVFYQNLLNAAGCDSLVVTTVLLLPSDTVAVSAFICNPAATGIPVGRSSAPSG